MSGIHHMFFAVGASGAPVSFTNESLQSTTIGVTAQAGLTWGTNGSLASFGAGSFSWSGPTNWFAPTTTSIGNSYWIKFELTPGGDPWDVSTSINDLQVYPLSSARTVQWTQTIIGTKFASVTVRIYTDSGGTNLVATGTFDVTVTQD